MKILNPCKNCPDRHPICHDSCPRYAEYKRQLKAQRIYTNGNHAAERMMLESGTCSLHTHLAHT